MLKLRWNFKTKFDNTVEKILGILKEISEKIFNIPFEKYHILNYFKKM